MTRTALGSVLVVALLAGCASSITLMPRDSGQTYTGEMSGHGGHGTLSLAMGQTSCTGPIAKVASGDTVGIASGFGGTNRGTYGTAISTMAVAGDSQFKAMLSCSDGSGLRCDLTGRSGSGGGVCMDDRGKVYDAIVTRK